MSDLFHLEDLGPLFYRNCLLLCYVSFYCIVLWWHWFISTSLLVLCYIFIYHAIFWMIEPKYLNCYMYIPRSPLISLGHHSSCGDNYSAYIFVLLWLILKPLRVFFLISSLGFDLLAGIINILPYANSAWNLILFVIGQPSTKLSHMNN